MISDFLHWPLRNFRDGRLLQLRDFRGMPLRKLQKAVRCMAQTVYLGGDTALCRILGRYKLFVDTKDLGFASHIMLDGFWELWLTQFLARRIQRGMVVIDIGANFGYYSLLMAELVSASGSCISIEPNPKAADSLEASIAINGFARRHTLLRYAAGDGSEAAVTFFIPHNEPKNGRIVGGDTIDTSGGQTLKVDCASIDALCGQMDRVDFIKIDAEGAEPLIFQGMRSLLNRCKPDIIVEFNYERIADPEGFLAEIALTYPVLRYLDVDGRIKPISTGRLASENLGEDWLLFLSVRQNVHPRR